MRFDYELVGKIGSMALVDRAHGDIDYNKFSRIGRELRPGMIWVSSGAVEIGRIDYRRRMGRDLAGGSDAVKTDCAAEGQAVLMKIYRDFVDSRYALRQVLVEHQHFNDAAKRAHLKDMFLRCAPQGAIPIVNYNDAVSFEESRKLEIEEQRRKNGHAVELVDNDETAAQIACLVHTRNLVILTGVDGIYADPDDAATLVREIAGKDADETIAHITEWQSHCSGASRAGANGAGAKLEYIKPCVAQGTTVYIANAEYSIAEILDGRAPSTCICTR